LQDFSKVFDGVNHLLCSKNIGSVRFYYWYGPSDYVISLAIVVSVCRWYFIRYSTHNLLFFMFINDIVSQITSCRVHLYVVSHNTSKTANYLAINPEKSQALLINPSILLSLIVSPLLLGTNQIAFVNKVKNLGITFNQDLTWHNQFAKLCRGVFFTLRRLWTFS
jgi:hypothetical protein